MNIREWMYKLKNRISFQFIKHSWLDMKRDRAKTIFGAGGICISIILLTAIGMINDTMGYNYMQSVTNTVGSSDIIITRSLQTDLTFEPYFDEDIIETNLANIEGVEQFFPRIMMLVKTSSDTTSKNGSLQMYGFDFIAEYENGNMGDLVIVDEDGEPTGEKYSGEPDDGECVILAKVAELLNLTRGDTIHLQYQQHLRDVTVIEICEQDTKFTQLENALILVNIPFAQDFLNRLGQLNMISGVIENRRYVYDASNTDATQERLRVIGSRIQARLDINKYTVTMPKLEELETAEFMLMMTTIIFWFIIILSMLITGILINSILSTSIEERVREFGITRVVGGKKSYPMKIVLFEGLLFGMIGSIIGILLGLWFTPPVAQQIFAMFGDFFDPEEIQFFIKPETAILTFSIGSLVSLFVAFIPALRTAKLDIIKSITPFQTKEDAWEVTKEGSMNVRSFLIGISIATIGMIIFVLFPRILTTGNFMLIAALFIGLLAAILLGLVFASVGIIPLIQRVFLGIISPGIKKYANIIKISLKRYRRRNTSTVVMFAISFSFIFFITSVTEMESENMALNLEFQYGADLTIINQGSSEGGDAVTLEMLEELKIMQQIDEVAYAIHNTFDIQAALSVAFDITEGGIGFDEDDTTQQIMNLINYYDQQWSEKYITKVWDNLREIDVGLIGVDTDFINLVDRDMIIWSSPQSNFNSSFSEMLARNNTCIIAKSIANLFGINDVGEDIWLNLINPQVEGNIGNRSNIFKVVGITGGIPGFYNFRSGEYAAYGGGVMVSADTYAELMDVEHAGQPEMILDKVFINLKDNDEETIENLKDEISTLYSDKNFIIDDAVSKITFFNEMNERQSALMELVLMFTVMICIFGLISSMYAIMLERKFEIGILRSMGMKARNVRNMFLFESMVILLSAGIMGTVIGSYTAYLLQTNLGLLTEMPVIFAIPIDTLLRVFIISVSVGILGMYLILMKLSRQTIMEVFRQTF